MQGPHACANPHDELNRRPSDFYGAQNESVKGVGPGTEPVPSRAVVVVVPSAPLMVSEALQTQPPSVTVRC